MRLREGVEVRPTLIDETFAVRARIDWVPRWAAASVRRYHFALANRLHRLMRGSGLH
jgi:hypothetical protein